MLGQVYFVTDGEAIKIGYSGAAKHRLKELQSCYPRQLSILVDAPGSMDDEKNLHKKFAHLRLRGEWFRSDPELLKFIEDVRTNLNLWERGTINCEIAQVRRDLARWAQNKIGRTKLYCESLDSNLQNMIENPHYPDLRGCAAMAIEALESAIAAERRRTHQ